MVWSSSLIGNENNPSLTDYKHMTIGYDNYNNRLPEPPLSKVLTLIERLSKSPILVIAKTLRRAWFEDLTAYVGGSPCQGQARSNGLRRKSLS